MSRPRSASVSSTRSLDPEIKSASEAAAREKVASLALKVYTEAGDLVPYEPSKSTVEAIATRIRAYQAAKSAGKNTSEKKDALAKILTELHEKVSAANLRSAKALLKKVHKVEVRNTNAENVRAFHNAMEKGNATRRNAIVEKLKGMQEVIKTAKKTMRSAKVGAELQALRNAGYNFNNKYHVSAANRTMLALLGNAKPTKAAAAREHFAEALEARKEALAKKVKTEKVALELNVAALASATAALQTVRGAKKVDPKNAERYARMLALSAGSGLDIKPEHYYGIFREAFKTRRAKKANNASSKAGAGAGAGAGAAAANHRSSSSSAKTRRRHFESEYNVSD